MSSIGFVPGTLVLTPAGFIPIEEVSVGSSVLGASSHEDALVPVRVVGLRRGVAVGLVHMLFGTDSAIEFVVAGWDQRAFAVSAESWVYGYETPGWIALGDRPSDLFLRSGNDQERVRLEQTSLVVRTATKSRGFIRPNRMDQALGAWLEFSGSTPQAIPHPGDVSWEGQPGLVLNDLDVYSLPEGQRSYACETLCLQLEGEHGFFVGRRRLFVLVEGAA